MPRKAARKNRKRLASVNAKDVKLLQEGFVPNHTKLGKPFKGKNKIIVV